MGFRPYGAPEVYYYAERPYRSREGGEGNAKFVAVDISSTLDLKCMAIELLLTYNRWRAAHTKLRPLDDLNVRTMARSYTEEFAETIGKKHGLRYAEEFNYVNLRAG